jgi:hypothetical protein
MPVRMRAGAVRAMCATGMQDGIVESSPFAGPRISTGRGRKEIIALTGHDAA